MAQQKPEDQITIKEVLKLVDHLSPEGRVQLLDELKLQALRRDIQIGIDEADRGELVSEDQVLQHLDECRKKVIERQK